MESLPKCSAPDDIAKVDGIPDDEVAIEEKPVIAVEDKPSEIRQQHSEDGAFAVEGPSPMLFTTGNGSKVVLSEESIIEGASRMQQGSFNESMPPPPMPTPQPNLRSPSTQVENSIRGTVQSQFDPRSPSAVLSDMSQMSQMSEFSPVQIPDIGTNMDNIASWRQHCATPAACADRCASGLSTTPRDNSSGALRTDVHGGEKTLKENQLPSAMKRKWEAALVPPSSAEANSTKRVAWSDLPSSNDDAGSRDQGSQKSPVLLEPVSIDLSLQPNDTRLSVRDVGLPWVVALAYETAGVMQLYPWQAECLRAHEDEKQQTGLINVLYSAPTSGGKTMVSEILMIKAIMKHRGLALFVLPFVSIVNEKVEDFRKLYSELHPKVEVKAFHGGEGSTLPNKKTPFIAVCTIEKANMLMNSLLGAGRIEELCVVVVDELHMISEQGRGQHLELMLSKSLAVSKRLRREALDHQGRKVAPCLQIIGMSATLPNLGKLASWMQAVLYTTDWRPVPLTSYAVVDNDVYDDQLKNILRTVRGNKDDVVATLVEETTQDGHAVIVFCPSKAGCEMCAKMLATKIKHEPSRELKTALDDVVKVLNEQPGGLHKNLALTLPHGVAFHHAGLTKDERVAVENMYRKGALHIICATSTLAAGINLPARRVIINEPKLGKENLTVGKFRQMCGRAGRAGKHDKGESYLVATRNQSKIVESLLRGSLPPLASGYASEVEAQSTPSWHSPPRKRPTQDGTPSPIMNMDLPGMERAVLEVVCSSLANSAEGVAEFAAGMLMSALHGHATGRRNAKVALASLMESHILKAASGDNDASSIQLLEPTAIGQAMYGSGCLSADEGNRLHDELRAAREGVCLREGLVLLYYMVPTRGDLSPQWNKYGDLFDSLDERMKRCLESSLGLTDMGAMKAARDGTHAAARSKEESSHARLFNALALSRLVNEDPIDEIAEDFGVDRGALSRLMEEAGYRAAMVVQFCTQMEWWDLALILGQTRDSLVLGVSQDLIDIAQLNDITAFMTPVRARVLHEHGFNTILKIAEADSNKMSETLMSTIRLKSGKPQTDDVADAEGSGKSKEIEKSSRQDSSNVLKRAEIRAANHIVFAARAWLRDEAQTQLEDGIESAVAADAKAEPRSMMDPLPFQTVHIAATDTATPGLQSLSGFANLWREQSIFSWSLHVEDNEADVTMCVQEKIPLGMLVCWEESHVYYLPLGKNDRSWSLAKRVMESHLSTKICCNAQSALRSLLGIGIQVEHTHEDPAVAGWLLRPDGIVKSKLPNANPWASGRNQDGLDRSDSGYCLPILLREFLPFEEFQKCSRALKSRNQVDQAAMNAHCSRRLMEVMHVELKKNDLAWCFSAVEMPVVPVCAELEHGGIGFSVDQCHARASVVQQKIVSLQHEIDQLSGRVVELHCAADVRAALNENVVQEQEQAIVIRSTSASHLRELAVKTGSRLPMLIAQYRCLSNTLHKFISLLPGFAQTSSIDEEDQPLEWNEESLNVSRTQATLCEGGNHRIYPTYMHIGNQTGRIYTSDPNLQGTPNSMEFVPVTYTQEESMTLYAEMALMKQDEATPNRLSSQRLSQQGFGTQHSPLHVLIASAAGKGEQIHAWAEGIEADTHLNLPLPNCTRLFDASLDIGTPVRQSHAQVSVVEHWRQNCHSYTDEQAKSIPLVTVKIRGWAMGKCVIPADKVWRATQPHIMERVALRDAFIPEPGMVFMAADYRQMELRLAAHYGRDERLIEILSASGVDVFKSMWAVWHPGTEAEEVDDEERNMAKATTYGLLYGMGYVTLARNLHCPGGYAKELITSFNDHFKGVQTFKDETLFQGKRDGYVKALSGRKRNLPDLTSTHRQKQASAERQAFNSVVQGSAGDLMKIAMVAVSAAMQEDRQTGGPLASARLVMNLHDELVRILKQICVLCTQPLLTCLLPRRCLRLIQSTWRRRRRVSRSAWRMPWNFPSPCPSRCLPETHGVL